MPSVFGSILSPDSRRATGLAALVSTAGFAWLSLFAAPGPAEMIALLLVASATTHLAGKASHSVLARVLLVAIPLTGIGLAVYSIYLPDATRAYLRTRGFAVAGVSIAGMVWSNASGSALARQRRALWAAAAASVPPLLARSGTPALLLLLVAGSALYLWDEGDPAGAPALNSRYLLQVTGVVLVSALLVFAIAPPVFGGLTALAALVLEGARRLLLLLLRPVGYLAEYIVNALQKHLGQLSEKPLESMPGRSLLEELERQTPEWTPTLFTTIVEYTLVAAAIATAGWLLWRTVKSMEDRRNLRKGDTRVTDWSGTEALNWVASKGRELVATALDLARSLIHARMPARDPLTQVYLDFLAAAKDAGCTRGAAETPLEFGSSFGRALPAAESSIRHVSSEFSRHFYSGTQPLDHEMAVLLGSLGAVKRAVAERREHPLDRQGPVL